MPDLIVSIKPQNAPRIIRRLSSKMPKITEQGLDHAGRFLDREIKKRAGKGRPGLVVRTGNLRRSVNYRVSHEAGGFVLRVGPNTIYASIHEFGGRIGVTDKMRRFLAAVKGIYLRKSTSFITIPARPYVWPSYRENERRVLGEIQEAIRREAR